MIPAIVVVAMAAAAAAWIDARPAEDLTQIACYRDVDLRGAVTVVAPLGDDPREACAGVFAAPALAGNGAPPLLEACVLEGGFIGVFPVVAGDPCSRLGLDHADDPDPAQSSGLAWQRLLRSALSERCLAPDEAADVVRRVLDEAGVTGWTIIDPTASPAGDSCTRPSIDSTTQTITMMPAPSLTPD